ncbi:Sec22 [Kluyveromyces lactis]|nr:Sec22 [Kluyveromyces lactis]
MIRSTLIFREDGLPLCASVDDDTDPSLQEQKKKVKILISRFTPTSANEATVESGDFEIHYIRLNTVVYIVVAERNYPRNLAFSYLADIQQEFEHSYGGQLSKSNVRP